MNLSLESELWDFLFTVDDIVLIRYLLFVYLRLSWRMEHWHDTEIYPQFYFFVCMLTSDFWAIQLI